MDKLCITDAAKQFGITSKTLRYYERVGLLEAKRADNNNYRNYDELEVERIKQIMVLRKMQISIKDIIRIYENADMSILVEVFVNRINTINEEIGTLSELKRITNDFLQTMLKNGITKISALPILYEQIEKQLDILDRHTSTSYTELSLLSDKLTKPTEPSILSLLPMRVLSSFRNDGKSAPDGFWRWVQEKAIPQGEPGQHERFEFQKDEGDVFILKISDDFVNDGEYVDYIFPGGLFAAEIEAANPILWTTEVPLDTLKPINHPHYKMLDSGELEYIGWISTRVLSTEVKVKLPFRVDVEFRLGDGKQYGHGATEDCICLYHGEHGLNHNYGFGVNMGNYADENISAEALTFHQPIFRDKFHFPKRGMVNKGVYNKLTWIFGEKHLARIINGEVRYCGENFPYMALDLSRESKKPIIIGSNGQGKKYFRSICVSQLAETPKTKLKKGELIMHTKQSNNIIPVIR